ncbi:hypothetical protein TELCIR_13771, partial [Teladorsagia circumcincta]
MPSSGPGRQLTIRKSSMKKKKKKDQVVTMEKRGSAPVLDVPDPQQEGDALAMTEHADKVDEYYYGLRIFPGQDPSLLEPGAMLFPAAFFTPTTVEILQFELGRVK